MDLLRLVGTVDITKMRLDRPIRTRRTQALTVPAIRPEDLTQLLHLRQEEIHTHAVSTISSKLHILSSSFKFSSLSLNTSSLNLNIGFSTWHSLVQTCSSYPLFTFLLHPEEKLKKVQSSRSFDDVLMSGIVQHIPQARRNPIHPPFHQKSGLWTNR